MIADVEAVEWSGTATWLTSQNESQALATALPEGGQAEAPELLLHITIGFRGVQSATKASKKHRRHRSRSHDQDVVLSTTLAVKVVSR